MHSSNSKPTIDLAKAATERLLGFYPPMTASDPQVFIAGLVDLLSSYSPPTIQRSFNAVHGLPSRFKFLPNIAEIRETLEAWEAEEIERQERIKRWKVPKLPPSLSQFSSPKATATYAGLCELYGVNAVPPGWDAIEMCRAAALHGSGLQAHIDAVMSGRAAPPPSESAFQKAVRAARKAMDDPKPENEAAE